MSNLSPAEELFFAAIEKPTPEERNAFLDQACQAPELRQRVERLIAAHAQAGSFLERGPAELQGAVDRPTEPPPARAPQAAGDRVGPYKLLEQIGEGGMGVVFMAEQQTPVRRRVALKIIKPGMDTRQVIARFEAERQALALMDHPNIARVFDAGETERGRPYFVMELVPGVPITEYCDRNQLPIHERLELFIQVCHAVQHAHQKGIIHRDIKPSNVLVTLHDGRGVPKVIDFGVAKAISQQLTDKTVFTNFAMMVGTPLYMAPEQAELTGLDIDTRADVYSLGVLLYELLTGTTPCVREQLDRAAYDEVRRIIREQEPPRPSLRVGTLGESRTVVASHRRLDPQRLSNLIRGDLDWIVMRALDKDRRRRYDSATGMARDVERYLTDEPIEARPPSAAYRFRKYARRNRAAMVTVGLTAAVLLLGTAISTWQAIRATRAEHLAETARAAAITEREKAQAAAQAAEAQKFEADRQRADAQREKARAERLAYGYQVRLANTYWESGETADAWNTLDSCEAGLRGWEHDYLYTQLTMDHLMFDQAAGDVAFSPDGRRIYMENIDELNVLDAETGTVLRSIKKDDAGFSCLDLSSDGRRLAHGLSSGAICIRDAESGRELIKFSAHPSSVACVDFSPDGAFVASCASDHSDKPENVVKVWDATSGMLRLVLKGHEYSVDRVAYSPDGSKIASGSWDRTARIWDAKSGEMLEVLRGHRSFVGGVAFSPNGRLLATAGMEGLVIVWDQDSGEAITVLQLDDGFPDVVFSPDGSYLAANDGMNIAVLEIPKCQVSYVLRSHFDLVSRLAYSSDGRRLVSSGSGDETVMVWDLERHQSKYALPQRPKNTAGQVYFSPDGGWLLTNMDEQVAIWDVETRHKRLTIPHEAITIALSADGRVIASGGRDASIRLWDFETGRELHVMQGNREHHVTVLAFSPDSQMLISHCGVNQFWDAKTGRELLSFDPGYLSSNFAFTPDSQRVAFTGSGGVIPVWSIPERRKVFDFERGESSVYTMAYSPDGRRIAMGGHGIVLRDAQTGQVLLDLSGHTEIIHTLAFSPDGSRLASGGNDKTVRLWDIENGQEVLTLKAGGKVQWLTFSPDGRRIASMSDDVGLEMWEATRTMELPSEE